MTNLVVDIGNSRMKAAVFIDGRLTAKRIFQRAEARELDEVFREFPAIDRAILSSTCDAEEEIGRMLAERAGYFIEFAPGTPTPLDNRYSTPRTLGCDRVAAAAGAAAIFRGRNIFIVDLGSAITEDIVTAQGCYMGGSISPGMAMRFRALGEFTGRLPIIDGFDWQEYMPDSVPSSTREAIVSGVAGGIEMELRGRMEHYSRLYPHLVTIFTGGDAPFFEKIFKNTIFADYELVLRGLNIILNYNADKKDSI